MIDGSFPIPEHSSMLPNVLRRLEALRANVEAIDPATDSFAADRVASMAVALREVLAVSGLAEFAAETIDTADLIAAGA